MSKSTEWLLRVAIVVVLGYFGYVAVERAVVNHVSAVFGLRVCNAELQKTKAASAKKAE